jgi:hypothetical protein
MHGRRAFNLLSVPTSRSPIRCVRELRFYILTPEHRSAAENLHFLTTCCQGKGVKGLNHLSISIQQVYATRFGESRIDFSLIQQQGVA